MSIIKVLDAAQEVEDFCRKQNWRFCFIGGVAVQRWGQPRVTADADLTLLTGFGDEASYIDTLLMQFKARRPDARRFALLNRVLLLHATNAVGIDIGLGALPFEEHTIERASIAEIAPGYSLTTCCAEDLITHKAFAGRPQDWLDVETILMRQNRKLNLQIVWEELTPLAELKEEPEILERLRALIKEILGAKYVTQPSPRKPAKRRRK